MMTFFGQNDAVGQYINGIAQQMGVSTNIILLILVTVLIWSMVWKLLGLWKSARNGSWVWFVVIALTNTVGILSILYIYVFSKTDWSKYINIEIKKPKSFRKSIRAKIQQKFIKKKK